VTSPWDSRIHVEDAYREALMEAFAEIQSGRTFWYFLHIRLVEGASDPDWF